MRPLNFISRPSNHKRETYKSADKNNDRDPFSHLRPSWGPIAKKFTVRRGQLTIGCYKPEVIWQHRFRFWEHDE
jgi:hypothetical protein